MNLPCAPRSTISLTPLNTTTAAAINTACAQIAPTWPLDRFIAVNPFWSHIDTPFVDVARSLSSLSGAQLLMPRAWFREQKKAGHFTDAHLQEALRLCGSSRTLAELLAVLSTERPAPAVRARVTDVVDASRDLVHEVSWRDHVIHSISQFCAAFFDEGQAQCGPARDGGLYASWHRQLSGDRAPELLCGLNTQTAATTLPSSAAAMIAEGLATLKISADDEVDYLESLLLEVNGWASWCAYRRFMARLEGADDDAIVELLAIRLAWEVMVFRSAGTAIAARWTLAMAGWRSSDDHAARAIDDDDVFLRAIELAYQKQIAAQLPSGLSTPRPTPRVQAAFCIDVRSEVIRRALESQQADVQTLGFAGFFGLPVDYRSIGAATARPQLPGLLAPRLHLVDTGVDDVAADRAARLQHKSVWGAVKTAPSSTFAFVEAFGLVSLAGLIADSFGWSKRTRTDDEGLSAEAARRRKPRLSLVDVDERADLAAGILRSMSLTRDFARIVLLAGHGSDTRNNAHAAGLDCGACCGQTGEVNARAVAALLNDPAVRAALVSRGIHITDTTHFLGGLHNTTTDDISLFDLDELPTTHQPDLAHLRAVIAVAGGRARHERAPALGLHREQRDVHKAVRKRTSDWAEMRAEWGLANNASFIVGPREHCQHIDLDGRAFLHDYRADEDEGFAVLEAIMTAPMVVTHWINFQYYASAVDNVRYGSGNKVLHNVVGGHLGVFEGNGGDLRIGLPWQSLHDGEQFVHQPLRLSVFIEAPTTAIDGVLAKHAHVRQLVDNGWLHLLQVDAATRQVQARGPTSWTAFV